MLKIRWDNFAPSDEVGLLKWKFIIPKRKKNAHRGSSGTADLAIINDLHPLFRGETRELCLLCGC